VAIVEIQTPLAASGMIFKNKDYFLGVDGRRFDHDVLHRFLEPLEEEAVF
jgi:hypothetical protein